MSETSNLPKKRRMTIEHDSDASIEHGDSAIGSSSAKKSKASGKTNGIQDMEFTDDEDIGNLEDINKAVEQAEDMDVDRAVTQIIKLESTADFTIHLKLFYQRLFPFKEMHRWLGYGNVHPFHFVNREFSFTLASDTYIRFQSFKDAEQLRSEILRFCPVKIDIGAVYNIKPKESKTVVPSAFVPLERELVFDIDMTDYDEIRTCCKGADICKKCWSFMTISIKVLHRALKEDFGFKHILWVYSGRRGVHCWVSDERARKLSAESRRAMINYLEVIKGGESVAKKVNLKGALHPSLVAALDVCNVFFEPVLLNEMKILENEERWSKVLGIIPDDGTRKDIESDWKLNRDAPDVEKWGILKQHIEWKKKPALNTVPRDIILQYTYPRLDSNVSIGLNHLLKSPFCVHPKTGRVCVPIDPDECDTFDPFTVPKLSDLIAELDSNGAASKSMNQGEKIADYERTSLKPHVDLFKKFLSGINESIRDSLRSKRAEEDKKLQF